MSRVIIVCMLRFKDPTFIIYYTYIDILDTNIFFLRYLQPMEFAPDDSSFIIKSRHHFLKKDEDTK